MKSKAMLLVALLIITGRAGSAQTGSPRYDLDLAGGDSTTQVEPGKAFSYRLVNRVPTRTYTTSWKVEAAELPVLELPGKAETAAAAAATPCSARVDKLTADLQATKTEGDVRDKIAASKPFGPDCQKELQDVVDSLTVGPEQAVTLQQNQVGTLTVTRDLQGDEKTAKTWTFKFTTPPIGAWVMHYGFSFLGNRDRAFFAATQGDKFVITRKANRTSLQYLPTFAFTFVPECVQRRGWGPAFTAGIGTDLSNVAAFIGGSLIIGQNVNIYVGLAGTKQQRLTGKYHEGDVVKDNLTEDQLNEKVYVPTVLFGVGFRFTSNPFSSGNNSSSQAGKGKASGQ